MTGSESALDRRRLVYRWDLDKTYLRTEFDSLRDLVRVAFESPADKRTVPGAGVLLRELTTTRPLGIYIVSGSPEQLRKTLEAKLRLDGVRWDGLTLKPQLKNLLRGRFRFLRDQVGYKLAALLDTRASMPAHTDEFMFGDDAEADAFIYSIYADLCAGRVGNDTLMTVLRRAGVYEDDLPRLVRLASRVPRHDGCQRIFIHLDRVESPAVFAEYGPRVCPFYNYFQPALVLLSLGAIDAASVLRVGAELVVHHGFTADALSASFGDLVERGQVGRSTGEQLVEATDGIDDRNFAGMTPVLRAFARELERSLPRAADPAPVASEPIDYVGLFSRDKARARKARKRVTGR